MLAIIQMLLVLQQPQLGPKEIFIRVGATVETAEPVFFHTLTLGGLELGQINYEITVVKDGPAINIQLSPDQRQEILNGGVLTMGLGDKGQIVHISLVDAKFPPGKR